jgi:hypothetical protein
MRSNGNSNAGDCKYGVDGSDCNEGEHYDSDCKDREHRKESADSNSKDDDGGDGKSLRGPDSVCRNGDSKDDEIKKSTSCASDNDPKEMLAEIEELTSYTYLALPRLLPKLRPCCRLAQFHHVYSTTARAGFQLQVQSDPPTPIAGLSVYHAVSQGHRARPRPRHPRLKLADGDVRSSSA